MPPIRPQITKLELAFTVCVIFSWVSLLFFIAVRFGLFVVGPTSDIGTRRLFAELWLGTVVLAAIVGAVALIVERRGLMIIPFLFVGYTMCLFSLLLMTPYSNIETLEQLLAIQFGIYAAAYLFWLALLKMPLPRLPKSR